MTITAFRLIKRKRAATCFDGEGARLFGGRWNSKGKRVVYTSASQSLAILETLVHLDSHEILASQYSFRTATFDLSLCETLDASLLPSGWNSDIPINATRAIGDRWISEQRSVVLAVPSAITGTETNYILNPEHPDFASVQLGPTEDFAFSKRFF